MDLTSLFRAGARVFIRRPAYSVLVVATLALGIGGATAIFSLVHGILLRPLPYAEPSRIVTPDARSPQGYLISLSMPNYRDWRDQSRSFTTFGAYDGQSFVRETRDGAETVEGRLVLGDFFETLGLEAEVGRLIPGDDTGPGAEAVAVLGHAFWQRVFGGDPEVLGRTLVLDQRPYSVVGVLPEGVGFPRPDVDVYVPMGLFSESLPWFNRGSSFGARALARLAPGVTLSQAQEDMNRVTAAIASDEGEPVATAELRTLSDLLVGGVRKGLWLLMGGVLLVLAIAGANVANLALARGEARAAELAVRRALGASTGDVARLVVAENLALALVGGGLGLSLAAGVVGLLPAVLPLRIPDLMRGGVGVSAPVVLFAGGVTVLVGVVFALIPALRGALAAGTLRHGARTTGGVTARRTRDALVVAQVALSFVLLASSGVLLRSLHRLSSVDKGFQDEGVFTARIAQPRGAFDSAESWQLFYDQLLEQVGRTPEVEAVAASLLVPLTSRSWERGALPDNVPYDEDEAPSVLFNVVSEDYFQVMGTPLLRGRAFRRSDADDAPLVAVVDESMAQRFWPGEDPVGKRVTLLESRGDGDDAVVWRTVVGVVPNVRHYELASPSRIQAWIPMRQALRVSGVTMTVLARTSGRGGGVGEVVRRAVAGLRPDIPVSEARMLSTLVADDLGESRALSATTTLFGTVAAALAALGIFGILSLAVARRAREMGLRMAVGARPGDVVGMVLRRGLALTAVGVLVGAVASVATGRILGSVLYQVRPWDTAVLSVVVATLAAVAVAASLHPALRAARTAPAEVLRQE